MISTLVQAVSSACSPSQFVCARCVQLDADGSGTLDVEEIFEYVRFTADKFTFMGCVSLYPRRVAMQLADMDENIANELMSVLDENGDGEVDFEEFCNGWERIFIVGGQDADGSDRECQQGGAVDDNGEAAAAATVQSHFRGHQARKEVAFRKQLRDQRIDEQRRQDDEKWDSKQMDNDGSDGTSQDPEQDDYVQPLHELGLDQELENLDAGRKRQAQQKSEAAALRRAQELELEAEAMAREEAYLNRMREGLVRRGLLGSAASQRSSAARTQQRNSEHEGDGVEADEEVEARALEDYEAEVDAKAAAAMGTKSPSRLLPSTKQALSVKVGPLTTPTPEVKAEEMIRWGGPEGIRLVLRHNLRKLAENEARNRSTLL